MLKQATQFDCLLPLPRPISIAACPAAAVACHPALFIDKLGANQMKMLDLSRGQFCGHCHGKVSFPFADCLRCHKKSAGKGHVAESKYENVLRRAKDAGQWGIWVNWSPAWTERIDSHQESKLPLTLWPKPSSLSLASEKKNARKPVCLGVKLTTRNCVSQVQSPNKLNSGTLKRYSSAATAESAYYKITVLNVLCDQYIADAADGSLSDRD